MPLATDAGDHSTAAEAAHLIVNDEDILLTSVDGSVAGKRRNSSSDEVDSGYSKSSSPTDSAPTAGSVRYALACPIGNEFGPAAFSSVFLV